MRMLSWWWLLNFVVVHAFSAKCKIETVCCSAVGKNLFQLFQSTFLSKRKTFGHDTTSLRSILILQNNKVPFDRKAVSSRNDYSSRTQKRIILRPPRNVNENSSIGVISICERISLSAGWKGIRRIIDRIDQYSVQTSGSIFSFQHEAFDESERPDRVHTGFHHHHGVLHHIKTDQDSSTFHSASIHPQAIRQWVLFKKDE